MSDYWNRLPKQRYLRGNNEGIYGDCWRCCIAAITNRPAEEVPHFMQLYNEGKLKSVSADTQSWLNDNGYAFIKIEYGGLVYCPTWAGKEVAFPMMECGPTIRSERAVASENHCVVTIGGQLVYDPHPSGAGLLATVERYIIARLPEFGM